MLKVLTSAHTLTSRWTFFASLCVCTLTHALTLCWTCWRQHTHTRYVEHVLHHCVYAHTYTHTDVMLNFLTLTHTDVMWNMFRITLCMHVEHVDVNAHTHVMFNMFRLTLCMHTHTPSDVMLNLLTSTPWRHVEHISHYFLYNPYPNAKTNPNPSPKP